MKLHIQKWLKLLKLFRIILNIHDLEIISRWLLDNGNSFRILFRPHDTLIKSNYLVKSILRLIIRLEYIEYAFIE